MQSKLSRFSNRQLLPILVILTIIVRVVFFFIVVPYDPVAKDRDEYLAIARNIVAGKGFSLLDEDTNTLVPTSKRGPTTSYFFAGAISILGDHTLSIALANWMIDAIISVVLYLLVLEIFGDKSFALTSALLWVFYFPEMYYAWQALSEPLSTLLTALFALSFLHALRFPSLKTFGMSGFLLAASALTRPLMLYFLPVAIIIIIYFFRTERNAWLKWGFTVSIFFIMLMLPWISRNYLIFREIISVSSNTGITMYHGNFALGDSDWMQVQRHYEGGADLDKKIPPEIRTTLTQPQRDHIATTESLKIIKQYPERYLILSLFRVFRMWYFIQGENSYLSLFVLIFHGVLLVLAMMTWLFYRGSWWRHGLILVVLIFFNNVGNAVIRTNVRYIIPVIPYVMIFASVSLVQIFKQIHHRLTGLEV